MRHGLGLERRQRGGLQKVETFSEPFEGRQRAAPAEAEAGLDDDCGFVVREHAVSLLQNPALGNPGREHLVRCCGWFPTQL